MRKTIFICSIVGLVLVVIACCWVRLRLPSVVTPQNIAFMAGSEDGVQQWIAEHGLPSYEIRDYWFWRLARDRRYELFILVAQGRCWYMADAPRLKASVQIDRWLRRPEFVSQAAIDFAKQVANGQ